MYDDDVRTLLSLARTALTDPGSLPVRPIAKALLDWDAYAVEKLDEAMATLDVEDEPARALGTLGRLVADVADAFDDYGVGGDGVEFDTRHLAAELHSALNAIDGVIAALDADAVEILR